MKYKIVFLYNGKNYVLQDIDIHFVNKLREKCKAIGVDLTNKKNFNPAIESVAYNSKVCTIYFNMELFLSL